jgi:hypothetical protein
MLKLKPPVQGKKDAVQQQSRADAEKGVAYLSWAGGASCRPDHRTEQDEARAGRSGVDELRGTNTTNSLFVWLVADGWCWFVLRGNYCWLVVVGWFVLREKYCQANRVQIDTR